MIISDLYNTIISCSNYNPSKDTGNGETTITVTVKLEDFNKAGVTGKEVILECDKGYFKSVTGTNTSNYSNTTTKRVSQTTRSDGTISVIYVPSEGGLCTFSANASKIQVYVNEPHKHSTWTAISNGFTSNSQISGATVYLTVNPDVRIAQLVYANPDAYKFTSADNYITFGVVNSSYTPKHPVTVTCRVLSQYGYVDTDGVLKIARNSTSSSKVNVTVYAMWYY